MKLLIHFEMKMYGFEEVQMYQSGSLFSYRAFTKLPLTKENKTAQILLATPRAVTIQL